MGSNILFGTELSCLGKCDESGLKFCSEDSLQRAEVIVVDIRHERDEFVCVRCGRDGRGDVILACVSSVYMRRRSRVSTFELPYHFGCMYISFVHPFIVGVGIPLPFDKVLLLASSAELPSV